LKTWLPLLVWLAAGVAYGAPMKTPPQVVIRNPSMTEGSDKPVGWADQWISAGKIAVSRDAAVFHSAPAALAVASVGGPAHAQAMQFIVGAPGQRLALHAWVRAEGKATAIFAVQSYTADWKGIAFKALGKALPGFDWQEAGGEVTLPPKTARFAVVLLLQGEGKAWLDDVEVGTEAGVAAPPAPQVEPPPKAANAWSPAEGFWKDFPLAWRQTAQGQSDRAKQGGVNVVFLGDSLTQGWDKQLWQERYAPLGAVNFGIGGDGTPQVLWRLEHGILEGIRPKVVVLMIGINNTWPGYSAADSAKGIAAIVAATQQQQPQAKILLLGVLPIHGKLDAVRKIISELNAASAKLDDGRRVRFLDLGAQFVDSEGSLRFGFYQPDRLHLTPAAYRLWADAMDPLLQEMLR
jgi:lysophospholipase L1-like esterase